MLIFAILPFTIQLSYAGTPAGTITYNAGTDTITVIGANSTHPAEFLDLYNVDVAGGWGQIIYQGGNQYTFSCKLVIGNGSATTYFSDSDKQITFTDSCLSAGSDVLINVTANGFLTLGVLDNANEKSSHSGVDLVSLETASFPRMILGMTNSTVYLYSCGLEASGSSAHRLILGGSSNRIWNCLFDRYVAIGDCINMDVNNVCISSSDYGIFRSTGIFNDLTIYRSGTAAFLCSNGIAFNLSNVNVICTSVVNLATIASAVNNYLINCVSDYWKFSFTASGVVYRQYTFDLFVLNGALTDFVEDANVTLVYDGTVFGSWLTNSTGQIDTKTLTYGFYNQTGGNTMYGGTAWTLTITHPDWTTYTSVFYPYSQIEWSISMQDTSTADNNMVTIGLLLGGIAFLGIIVIRRKQS